MDMINVLNTIPESTTSTGAWVFGICALFLLFCSIVMFKGSEVGWGMGCFIGFLLSLFCGAASINVYTPTVFVCTIKEDVRFVDFTSYFEVDKQEGLLYTVHVRETDDKK